MHFESGRAITAHDVEFSLRRAVARSSGSSWLLNALGLLPGNVDERVLALDDRRVQIHLSEPFAPNLVPSILAFPITSVVDREFIEQGQGEGTSAESPLKARSAGSGPYRLVQWEPNQSVALVANDDYWRGAPPVRSILVQHIDEEGAQVEALEQRVIDVAWNLSPQSRQDLVSRYPENLRNVQIPAHGIQYIGMNVSQGPLSDERVRNAVRWAIDYDAIRDEVMLGEALPLQGFIPSGYLGHDPATPFQRDVKRPAVAGISRILWKASRLSWPRTRRELPHERLRRSCKGASPMWAFG